MPRSRSMSLRVHHPLGDVLVLGEGAGLAQQLVDQRGLAVVDVGDDGDVAEVVAQRGHGAASEVPASGRGPAKQSIIAGQAMVRP